MNARWTYTIDGVTVHPMNTRGYELKYELEQAFIYDYRISFSGTIVLINADFAYLRSLEVTKRFEKINFKIFDTGVEVYNGEFVISDCDFDPYKSTATVKVTARDQYTAIEEVEDVEVNVVKGGVKSVTADIYSYWYFYCTRTTGGGGADTATDKIVNSVSLGAGVYVNLMVTELVKVDIDADIPTGFETTPFATLDKYVIYQRFPVNFTMTHTFDYIGPTDTSDYKWSPLPFYREPWDESIHNLIKINFGLRGIDIDFTLLWIKKSVYNYRANNVGTQAYRGMELREVMNRLIQSALPSFTGTVYSSFLFGDTDPGGSGTTVTDAYTALGFTPWQYARYLIEMSDFRRPNASEPATIGIMTWKQISEWLCQKYKIYWHIDSDGNIRFEHETYYDTEEIGTDLTDNPHITRRYKYIDAGKPNRETWSEASAWNEDFAELDVLYGTVPAMNGTKEVKTTVALGKIYTDIDGLNQHKDELSDDGFVLVEVYKDTQAEIPGESSNETDYGLLYNWYAASDARNIAASGWKLPANTDYETLSDYLGGNTVAGNKLKESGTTYWTTSGGTNISQFSARGGGLRSSPLGAFSTLKDRAYFWNAGSFTSVDGYISYIQASTATFFTYNTGVAIYSLPKISGASVRLIRDGVTSLEDGQFGTYTGNDGREYETVCIGTQEWLAENLRETKYRDGSAIPVVTDASAWIALTTGARCVYDNQTGGDPVPGHDAYEVVKATGFKSTDTDLQNVNLSNANCLNDYHRYRALQDVYSIGGREVVAITLQRMKYQQIEFAASELPDIEKLIATVTGNGIVKSIKFAQTVEHKYIAELLYD